MLEAKLRSTCTEKKTPYVLPAFLFDKPRDKQRDKKLVDR